MPPWSCIPLCYVVPPQRRCTHASPLLLSLSTSCHQRPRLAAPRLDQCCLMPVRTHVDSHLTKITNVHCPINKTVVVNCLKVICEDVSAACHGTFWGKVNDVCQEKIEKVHWELKDLNKYNILAPCYHHPENQELEFKNSSLPSSFRMLDYYHDTGSSVVKYHKKFTAMGYRVLIYSGDHDLCIPFVGTEAWVRSMGYRVIDHWRPWYIGEQIAGYTQGYEHNLTFITIKGAGHTVPEYKPKETLAFYSHWLSGEKI
ncbi:hypothetical protein GUJ93_ZPchr0015g6922 [Zizania palustris]|uniref:carboxypeptidase D n=1 Tax=Zizania palustris TaxID=103762 RepID=A0A8J5TLT8_ZIZPA|nr:hypothetical protein GUJ93_ZPchr0015g6922 [Zizania palustris]